MGSFLFACLFYSLFFLLFENRWAFVFCCCCCCCWRDLKLPFFFFCVCGCLRFYLTLHLYLPFTIRPSSKVTKRDAQLKHFFFLMKWHRAQRQLYGHTTALQLTGANFRRPVVSQDYCTPCWRFKAARYRAFFMEHNKSLKRNTKKKKSCCFPLVFELSAFFFPSVTSCPFYGDCSFFSIPLSLCLFFLCPS